MTSIIQLSPDSEQPTADPRDLPDGFTRAVVALLDEHGMDPWHTDDPHRAVGWPLTELAAFVAAYRTAPAAEGYEP